MTTLSRWLSLCVLTFVLVHSAEAASSTIVISQIYGGGGNAGTTLKNDFVELLNRGTTTISVDGWSIQYASSTGASWNAIPLAGSIQPGQYYLVAAAGGAGGIQDLPAAQATSGTVNFSATTGKIALVNSSTLLSDACPTGSAIVDFVGYGSANCAETLPAAALTNTSALLRAGNGCTDTDNNAADFSTGSPSPRNSASPRVTCPVDTTSTPGSGPTPPPPGVSGPSRTVGSAPLVFPHFAQGGGYQTTFTFSNASPIQTTVSLDLFSQNGSKTNTATVVLDGNGSGRFTTTGTSLFVGWARASASPPADITGTETIQLFSSNGSLVMEASDIPAQPDTFLRTPVFEKDGFKTGLAILNLGSSTATVSINVRSPNGTTLTSTTQTLAGSQQTARFVSELLPAVTNFEGTLELSSSSSIAAFALRQHLASGIFSTLPVLPQSIETYFSPRAGISTRIVQEIQRSQSSIDVAIYSFTRDEIADALIAAKNRGVVIRIIADTSQSAGLGSDIARLQAAGIPLKRTDGGGGGIMHNKVAIFDGRVLFTGSYNWSTAAEENNDENAIFLRNPAVIAAYQSAFNSLWATR